MGKQKIREWRKPNNTKKADFFYSDSLQYKRNESPYSHSAVERISWVDNAKALGIISVFYGHIVESIFVFQNVYSVSSQYKLIYSFHMPLFFILSGYLLKETQRLTFPDFMRIKFMTRIVPYLFFNIFIVPFHYIAIKLTHQDFNEGWYAQHSLDILLGIPIFNKITWFLICLFLLEVINYFLYPFLARRRAIMCAAIAIFYIIGWNLSHKLDIIKQYVPLLNFNCWYFKNVLVAYSFYLFGNLLANFSFFRNKLFSYQDVLLFLLTATCLLLTFNLNDGPFRRVPVVIFAAGVYGNIYLFPLTAIAGSICIISVSRLMPSTSLMRFLGRNTMSFMGLNGIFTFLANVIIINLYIYIFQKMYPLIFTNYFHLPWIIISFSLSCIALLLCAPFVILLKKYLPFAVGLWNNKTGFTVNK